jgi:hypothetical protein
MESPKETYKNNAGDAKIRKSAYTSFFDKYVKKDKDAYFLNLNEGNKISNTEKGFFIPGRIYTFQYDPLYKDSLSYYDKRPIIMVHEVYLHPTTKNELIVGINLNFLPETVRVTVLEYYYDKFKEDIAKSEDAFWSGEFIAASRKVMQFFKDWLTQLKIFETKGLSFSFAYRQYIKKNMKNATLIEYDDWHMIPFIQPKDIMGKGLGEIYNEYDKSLSANLKKEAKRVSKGKK